MILDYFKRPIKPFWQVNPPKGLRPNPLGYSCAPNQADASYAGAETIEEFIAYGFRMCWQSPGDFSLWWKLERYDIQWLRENFLRMLEILLLSFYEEGDKWDLPYSGFDWGEFGESLNIGNSDEGDPHEISITWAPHSWQEDVIVIDMIYEVVADYSPGESPSFPGGNDPLSIFLDPEAIKDKKKVRAAIAHARNVNDLPAFWTNTRS